MRTRPGSRSGTLYWHFPTRKALLLAVYRNEVQQLVEAAPALLASQIDPDSDGQVRSRRVLDIIVDGLAGPTPT